MKGSEGLQLTGNGISLALKDNSLVKCGLRTLTISMVGSQLLSLTENGISLALKDGY
jgi:hypothetical protein